MNKTDDRRLLLDQFIMKYFGCKFDQLESGWLEDENPDKLAISSKISQVYGNYYDITEKELPLDSGKDVITKLKQDYPHPRYRVIKTPTEISVEKNTYIDTFQLEPGTYYHSTYDIIEINGILVMMSAGQPDSMFWKKEDTAALLAAKVYKNGDIIRVNHNVTANNPNSERNVTYDRGDVLVNNHRFRWNHFFEVNHIVNK